ncbi:UDP-N-acetylglucosamine 2-epimerase (non-hydrolyzing) [Aliifodinibius salipaludis]|uniref:UDP-N-acetylglucosamine 2-epimerase (Non-hydrolyzing) n=1 Tax=Fodinibius salipaludis TaxID=2032627 RepID=A0A2A2G7R0_9BACT|nr:UDP-N-acetylglucosamine 2-epimerase (non-hydrolyzing) [Aliifodinibius salipaludis]PAU93160.1 UDP-N-acetylglucosamine 2-epimerase (non-hydrolyzing) [Aliifodinibius salipaludis]
MKIINVASARPNFMKVAPLLEEYKKHQEIEAKLLHTGQHYDYEMSKIFFDELGIPKPDFHLGVGSGTHAEQTAKVMVEFEKVLQKEQPDWVVVVGDVNPTMACTIVANKMGIKVAHVEAGLRSYDRDMPEEINRVLTDSIADLLLTPSIDGNMNLIKEGIAEEKIRFVGNIMIDTLFNMRKRSDESTILSDLGIKEKGYVLVTLHRPSNVDQEETLSNFVKILEETSQELPMVWPVHPRSKNNAEKFGLWERLQSVENLHLLEPVGYLDNVCLMNNARLVLTDSGGIQEETTALGVPCLTARENTERPITISEGTNTLVGTDPEVILDHIEKHLQNGVAGNADLPKPLYWDGNTAKRIVKAILEVTK